MGDCSSFDADVKLSIAGGGATILCQQGMDVKRLVIGGTDEWEA